MLKKNRKIRVGIDARTLTERGGVRNYVINLVENIKKNNDIELIIFYNNRKLLKSFEGVKEVALFPKFKFFLPIYDLIILPLFCVFLKVDVLHLPKSSSNFFPFLKRVTTLHDLIPITHFKTENFLNYLYWKLNFFMSVFFSHKIITVSNFSKNVIKKYYGNSIDNKDIEVIYSGINRSIFHEHSEKVKSTVRRKYNLTGDFCLVVGTIQPRKNIERYVDVFEDLNLRRKKKIKLVLVGRIGWKFNKKIFDNDYIIHLDSVNDEDLSALYSSSSFVLFASLVEGFGFPVLEAQACGAVVITSKNSPMEELARDSTFLVDPYVAEDILKTIEYLLDNEKQRKRLIKRGLLNVERYNWKKTAKETISVYRKLIYD